LYAMNRCCLLWDTLTTLVYPIVDSGVTITYLRKDTDEVCVWVCKQARTPMVKPIPPPQSDKPRQKSAIHSYIDLCPSDNENLDEPISQRPAPPANMTQSAVDLSSGGRSRFWNHSDEEFRRLPPNIGGRRFRNHSDEEFRRLPTIGVGRSTLLSDDNRFPGNLSPGAAALYASTLCFNL